MADVTYRGMSWSFGGDRTQWNFPGQTAASKCEGFQAFQELTPSLWGHLVLSFGSSKLPATRWRWGRSQPLKCLENFTYWHGCLPKKFPWTSKEMSALSRFWLIYRLCLFRQFRKSISYHCTSLSFQMPFNSLFSMLCSPSYWQRRK